MPTQDNLQVPSTFTLEARRTTALEAQALAATRIAAASASAFGTSGNPARDEFREVLMVCLQMRVAADLNGIFSYAQEIIDGLDNRYPMTVENPVPLPVTPPKTSP